MIIETVSIPYQLVYWSKCNNFNDKLTEKFVKKSTIPCAVNGQKAITRTNTGWWNAMLDDIRVWKRQPPVPNFEKTTDNQSLKPLYQWINLWGNRKESGTHTGVREANKMTGIHNSWMHEMIISVANCPQPSTMTPSRNEAQDTNSLIKVNITDCGKPCKCFKSSPQLASVWEYPWSETKWLYIDAAVQSDYWQCWTSHPNI